MTKKLFADSGFFIAMNDEKDEHQQASNDIFNYLKEKHLISDLKDLYITDYVLLEVLNDKRLSFNKMVEIYKKMKQCQVLNIEPEHVHTAVCDKLRFICNRKSNKARMGFVDATSLVIMDKHKIDCIISFDEHFDNLPDYYARIYNIDTIDQKILRLRR